MIRIILIALLAFTLTNCADKTYKVKQEAKVEDGRVLNEVPQWFVDANVDRGLIKNRDADDYIYGVGSGTSPDLQLAIDKAIMVAKASLADQLQGEMNKRADLYITEVGQEGNKQVATKVESTIVNIIKNTKVQGYEQWKIEISITPNSEYRVYLGLMLPLGEFNKLADLIEQEAQAKINSRLNDIETNADKAFEELSAVPVEKVTELM